MSIDSHLYYLASLVGENLFAQSSKRSIDHLTDRFGWPVGCRDFYQVHDLETHAKIMLRDKRLIKLPHKRRQEILLKRVRLLIT